MLLTLNSKPAWSLATVELVLNWKPEPQFGGFFAVSALELDKKYGFELKITPGGSGSPTIQLLANKKVPLAIISAEELIQAHAKKQTHIKALWATFQDNPQMIMVKKESGIKNIRELVSREDYRLLWQEGLPYAQFLRKKYAHEWKITTSPYWGGLGLFLQEKKLATQGLETSEPLLLPKEMNVTIFRVRDEGFNPYLVVLASHEEWLKTHTQLWPKVLKAVEEGWKAYLTNPSLVNAHMKKLNPVLSDDFLTKSAEAQKSLINKAGVTLGHIDKKRLAELARIMRQMDLISTEPKAELMIWPY
jgi:NitT/TauT family transport system substrate-binding protein